MEQFPDVPLCEGPPAARAAKCPVHGADHTQCMRESPANTRLLATLKEAGYDVHTRTLQLEAVVAAFTLTLADAEAVLYRRNPKRIDLSWPTTVTEARRQRANMAAVNGG